MENIEAALPAGTAVRRTDSAPAKADPRPSQADRGAAPRIGIGIEVKIFFFLITVLALLALIAAGLSARRLESELADEFESRGRTIATGLAIVTARPVKEGDWTEVRRLADRFAEIEGVAYAMVYGGSGTVRWHNFGSAVPDSLTVAPKGGGGGSASLAYVDPADSRVRRVIDLTTPIPGSGLAAVRIGMDRDEIVLAARDATTGLVVALGFTALLAAVAGFLLTRRAVRPIRRLVVIARKVGRGDFSELAPVTSNDEIGLLAHTFNDSVTRLRGLVQTEEERDRERLQREQLQHNISRFLDVATRIARGDLTLRGEVTSDVLGAVVDAINVMVEEIAQTLERVLAAASTVTSGAEDMIRSTERMVEGAQSQSRGAVAVRDRMDEITRMMREVADNASYSAEAAEKTRQAAELGQEAVHESLGSMARIRREVQSIARRVKSLGERSMEISEIVETLSSIASQTHLLALNAAIEASGAGEYGTRFAVVAEEVRKLATDSAQAAKRVGSMIKSVQTEVQDVVVAMEDGTREVEAGFRVNAAAGERLREIADISGTSARLAAEISTSSQGQVAGVDATANVVASIAEIASTTEREVMEGRQVAEQLLGLSDELNRYLARFQLKTDSD